MFRIWSRLWLALAFFLAIPAYGGAANAEPIDPEAVFRDVDNANARLRRQDVSLGDSLDRDIAILSEVLKDKSLAAESVILVRYYRAVAWFFRNEFTAATHRGIYDTELTQKALAEFEEVAAKIGELPAENAQRVASIKANALYFAGSVAYEQMKDSSKAYRYWTACSALDHAGCLSSMAAALSTGDGDLAVDLTEALRMHKRIFETATSYGCAGVYSAYSVALIVGLGAVTNTKDNAEIWIENASNLLNVIDADQPDEDRCSRENIRLAQYLIALTHGKKKPVLLDGLIASGASNPAVDVARYLKGALDQQSFEENLARHSDGTKCNAYFYALWDADIARDKARARHFQSLMVGPQDMTCRIDVSYTKALKTLQ